MNTPVPALATAFAPEFEILRPLGTGSLGNVYLAREIQLRRLVAIKVPLPELAADEAVRRRFEREAWAAARVVHPSAVTVYRTGQLPDGTPFLVMAYVEGRTLADLLRAEGPLPADAALVALQQLAEALAAAHEHGVIHRDVRPGNVIRETGSDRVVLTDFGIAGILDTGAEIIARITRAGEALGNPLYMSPEQLRAEPVTGATDIYSFGILAYELLTAQRPFAAASIAALADAHLRQSPRSLRDLEPAADPRLADLLLRCLAKTPEHRPSARAVADELARIRSGERGSARATGTVSGAIEQLPALATFLGELKRRRVTSVAILYLAAAFGFLEIAGNITPAMRQGERVYPMIVAATLGGFPIALVLAWIYDFTRSGVRRTEDVPRAVRSRSMRVLQLAGLLLSLLLAALLAWWLLSR